MGSKGNPGLVAALTVAATLGGLLFGYDTAVISGVTDAITNNFVLPRHLAEADANFLSGLAISMALLGCVIGAALAGPISTKIGRKGGLIIAGVLFFVSSLGAAYPEFFWSIFGATGYHALPAFLGYRLLAGMAIGMASMLAPMYIAEVAPPSSRGMLVTFQQIAIVVGITLVYFVNWGIQAGHTRDYLMTTAWRHMLASAAIPAALLIICMLLVPETPRFLVLKDRDGDALALLKRLVGEAEAQSTLQQIKATLIEHTRPLLSFGWLVLIVGIMLSIFQQVVGINAVLYYAPHMFENMGASTNQALWDSAIYSGVTMTVFTLIATFTVDKIGRKPLLVAGALIMSVAMILLGLLFDRHLVAATAGQAGASSGSSYIALGAVVFYILGFSFSWGPVVWVMLSEIFPNSIRGKAMSIAVAAQWIMNFVVSTTFPMMDGSSYLNAHFNHGFAYWVYGVCAALAALFVIRFVPETKGRPLESIQELWHRHGRPEAELASSRAAGGR
ncbi:MAG TPA: sugar porter family MFS transporter [Steroidobacteraceae bacterium]|nr:sugar porter family MFS transporter [Steroidobacteraceae bacterium]